MRTTIAIVSTRRRFGLLADDLPISSILRRREVGLGERALVFTCSAKCAGDHDDTTGCDAIHDSAISVIERPAIRRPRLEPVELSKLAR